MCRLGHSLIEAGEERMGEGVCGVKTGKGGSTRILCILVNLWFYLTSLYLPPMHLDFFQIIIKSLNIIISETTKIV